MMDYANQYRIKSLSSSRHEKFYTVSLTHSGEWQCSCPAWTRQSPRINCKHILSIIVQQMQAQPAQPTVKQKSQPVEVSGRRFR